MTSVSGEPGANRSSGRLLAKYDVGETRAGKKGIQTFDQKNALAKIFATVSRNLTSVIDPDTKELVVVDKKSLEAFLRRNQDRDLKKSAGEEKLFNTYMSFLSQKVWPRPKDTGIPTMHSGKITGTAGQFGDLFRALERVGIRVSQEKLLNKLVKDVVSGLTPEAATNVKGITFPLEVFANGLTIPDEARRLMEQQEPMESEAAVGKEVVSREIKDFIKTVCSLQVEKLPEEPTKGPAERSKKAEKAVDEKGDTLVEAAKIGLTSEQLRKNLAELTPEVLEDISRELAKEDLEMDELAALLEEKWTFGKEEAPAPPPNEWKKIAGTIPDLEKGHTEWFDQLAFDGFLGGKEGYNLLVSIKTDLSGEKREQELVGYSIAVVSELNRRFSKDEKTGQNMLQQLQQLPLRQQLYLCMATYAMPAVVSDTVKDALFSNLEGSIDDTGRTDQDLDDIVNYVGQNGEALSDLFSKNEKYCKILGIET